MRWVLPVGSEGIPPTIFFFSWPYFQALYHMLSAPMICSSESLTTIYMSTFPSSQKKSFLLRSVTLTKQAWFHDHDFQVHFFYQAIPRPSAERLANPFIFDDRANRRYMRHHIHVFRRQCAIVPRNLFQKYCDLGLLDPEHTIGQFTMPKLLFQHLNVSIVSRGALFQREIGRHVFCHVSNNKEGICLLSCQISWQAPPSLQYRCCQTPFYYQLGLDTGVRIFLSSPCQKNTTC